MKTRFGTICPPLRTRLLAKCAIVLIVCAWSAHPRGAGAPPEPPQAGNEQGPNASPAGGADLPKDEPRRENPIARLIRVPLPIDGSTFPRVRGAVRRVILAARKEGQWPVFIFRFEVAEESSFGAGSPFGGYLDLADFISSEELNEATTVAFVPQSIKGHAVLAVLACEQIVMAPGTEIGEAGIDEKVIGPQVRVAYREIAARRRTVPPEVALALLDPAIGLVRVETELSTQFVHPEDVEALRETHSKCETEVLIEPGKPGRLTAEQARKHEFVYLGTSRRDVARALDLPAESIEEVLGGQWNAIQVNLKGPIDATKTDRIQRLIKNETQLNDVNFVCLWIDSAGGSPTDSMTLANYLAVDVDSSSVRTVAYIPRQARSDAALIAMACDRVIMHPEAVLGGSGEQVLSQENIDDAVSTIRGNIAPRKSRSWSLMAAMFQPDLKVYKCTQMNRVEYFCDEEIQEQAEPDRWTKGELVSLDGKPFQAIGERAAEYRLASATVEDFAAFKQESDLKEDPRLVEPGWADFLVDALANPGVAIPLLMIGLFAMYAELQMPGIGIGGFIAAVCFLLFFWSRYLGGTAGWLEATLFAAGMVCLAIEVFVIPGFGIFGLGGAGLVLVSVVLASQTFIVPHNDYQFGQFQRSLLILAGAGVGVFVAIVMLHRWLPHTPVLGRVMLDPPSGEDRDRIAHNEALVHFGDKIGALGTTTTPLIPAGKARFDDELLDVIADGEIIPRATPVEIVEVHGNRIVVRATQEKA
ncbi:MAG: hypothetical protein HQ581_04000 [Planctomycetes bacterium]|nr:hypothetical protein [Planctomycetota bacterium]